MSRSTGSADWNLHGVFIGEMPRFAFVLNNGGTIGVSGVACRQMPHVVVGCEFKWQGRRLFAVRYYTTLIIVLVSQIASEFRTTTSVENKNGLFSELSAYL